MASILVTGARGFIGKHLSKQLAIQGHHVSGLGHGIWPHKEASRWGIRDWINGDVRCDNLRTLQSRHEPQLVFHLAGGSTVGAAIANPREDFFRTVTSTLELLEWIRLDAPSVRLIAISSAAVYGSNFRGLIPEKIIGIPYSPYGHHKSMMESLCRSYADTYSLDLRIARLFSVYGPELKKQLLWDICTQLAAKEPVLKLSGTGHELRDWTHVNDVVRGLTQIAFDANPPLCAQAINLGTGFGTSVQEIVQIAMDAWHEKSGNVNKTVVNFSGHRRPGDPFSLIADPARLSRMDFKCDVPLSEGVRSYIDWFQKASLP